MKPEFSGQADSVEHTVQTISPRHLLEVVPVQRIHAEADPVEPSFPKGSGLRSEERPIGGHGQVADAWNLRERSNQSVDSLAQ